MVLDPQLQRAVEFYENFKKEAHRAIIGLDDVIEKTAIAVLSEVPTTYSEEEERRVNAALMWLMGLPGVAKTYSAIVLAATTNTTFARIQGVPDLVPGDVVGVVIFNPKTGEFERVPGPIVEANIVLYDEGNRASPKCQAAFLEAFQDRTVTLGGQTLKLPEFSFGIMTANPVELGEGTYEVSDALADRFTFQVSVGYLNPLRQRELVDFNFKKVKINKIAEAGEIINLRGAIGEKVKLGKPAGDYLNRLVCATRPYNPEYGVDESSPSPLVEAFVERGASPRALIYGVPTVKVRALLCGKRTSVYPEDIQALLDNILRHRIVLKDNARSNNVTIAKVVADILKYVPVP